MPKNTDTNKQTDECLDPDQHIVPLAGREYVWPEPRLMHGRRQRAAIGAIIDWLGIPFSALGALAVDAKRVVDAEEKARLSTEVVDQFSKEKLFLLPNVVLEFFFKNNEDMRKDKTWLSENAADDAEIFVALVDLLGYLTRPFMPKEAQPIPVPEVSSTLSSPNSGDSPPTT